jgi:Ca2+-binding EF-hand superfamily protein
MLLNMIKYFNKKQAEYLAATNPHKLAKGSDGSIPLYLHIKVRSGPTMGLQEQFKKILNELGLEIVERRTNRQGRGLDAIVQTDLFVKDTTMTTKVQKIKALRKIKRALVSAEDVSSPPSLQKRGSLYKMGIARLSSNNLSSLDLKSFGEEDQKELKEAAAQEDAIIDKGNKVEKAIIEALGEDVEAVVDMWNPWPWTVILDNIAKYYELDLKRTSTTINTFLRVFETIDVDGSGTIDTQELYTALLDSGMDISEEGVSNLFGIIDEDGNGEILEKSIIFVVNKIV